MIFSLSLTLHPIEGRHEYTLACGQTDRENFGLLEQWVLGDVWSHKEVQWCLLRRQLFKYTWIDVLFIDRWDHSELFFALDDAIVSLSVFLLWLSHKVWPDCETCKSISQNLCDEAWLYKVLLKVLAHNHLVFYVVAKSATSSLIDRLVPIVCKVVSSCHHAVLHELTWCTWTLIQSNNEKWLSSKLLLKIRAISPLLKSLPLLASIDYMNWQVVSQKLLVESFWCQFRDFYLSNFINGIESLAEMLEQRMDYQVLFNDYVMLNEWGQVLLSIHYVDHAQECKQDSACKNIDQVSGYGHEHAVRPRLLGCLPLLWR